MARRRVLVVCPEAVTSSRTGVAIRMTEMARVLAGHHEVTLAAPAVESGLDLPWRTVTYPSPPLAEHLAGCDVAIVHGHVGNDVLDAGPEVPLVFDLYDPFVVENLSYASSLGPDVFRHDRSTLERQIRAGDFFLVATELQRAFVLGAMTMLSRVNPASYGKDRTLSHLVALAPFGVDLAPPSPAAGEFRSAWGGGEGPFLFYGGIYDWYDPETAVDALGILRDEHPEARLIVVRHPRAETTPQTAFGRALSHAQRAGVSDRLVVVDWIAYEKRGAALADADLGVITHRPGIETDLSFRTRVLDFLWAGLPVVSTGGGGGAELLSASGAGALVPPGEPEALAAAMRELLSDRGQLVVRGEAGQRWVLEHQGWDAVMGPLLEWLEDPIVDPDKPPLEAPGGWWRRRRGKRPGSG